jgi:hypothetical protein
MLDVVVAIADETREESLRRFDVALFIVHPTIDPAEISQALNLAGHIVHGVGQPRRTPVGSELDGHYRDTRWRHRVRYEVTTQHFSAEVTSFVDRLVPHRAFLNGLRESGGRAQVIITFLDGYFGDELPQATFAKMADLGLDLGIECFTGYEQSYPHSSTACGD